MKTSATPLPPELGMDTQAGGILARGAMLAAFNEKYPVITAEHVRVATTETL
jgi:hypothetical protein